MGNAPSGCLQNSNLHFHQVYVGNLIHNGVIKVTPYPGKEDYMSQLIAPNISDNHNKFFICGVNSTETTTELLREEGFSLNKEGNSFILKCATTYINWLKERLQTHGAKENPCTIL